MVTYRHYNLSIPFLEKFDAFYQTVLFDIINGKNVDSQFLRITKAIEELDQLIDRARQYGQPKDGYELLKDELALLLVELSECV